MFMGDFITIPLSAAVTVVDGLPGPRLVKTAISLPDIVRQTNAFSKKYRGGCSPKLLDSNPKALFLHYNVTCQKEDSDPGGHDVRIQFDVTKVQETSQAKDLDVQVSCSCPAFLYWGAQWNLHQRDGLLGTPRPELQPPTERLDLRGNFVICKHIHAVFERILPSVQHNIVKILREREIERKKDDTQRTPEELAKKQDRMKKKLEIEKIRKVKDKEIQDKLLEALRKKEEARMLHEQELDEQVEPVVERGAPGTQPVEEKKTPAWMELPEQYKKKPAPKAPPKTEETAIEDLYENEQKAIEEKHKEHKPHLHKGLPYKKKQEDLEEEE